MCVVKSCIQPVGESPTRPNGAGVAHRRYRVLRGVPRGALRSVDRNCAGRNALSGVKVSSPDNTLRGGRPFMEQGMQHRRVENDGTTGVQVHGMYRRLNVEHKRSVLSRGEAPFPCLKSQRQGSETKARVTLETEVRCLHSSQEVG